MRNRLRAVIFYLFGGLRSVQLRELYLSTAILDFAATAVLIYEPIYLYGIGFPLVRILLFYLATYILFTVGVPLGGKLIRAHGYEHGIVYSTPFLILYYLSLFAIPYSPIFIGVAVVASAIQKICYWPGYRADFARFGAKGQTGREISLLVVLAYGAAVLGPLFGGLVVAAWGFPILFLLVSIIILFSNIPLLMTPEVFTPRPFLYADAWKRLWKQENRRNLVAYMGAGEEVIGMIFWPLFLFAVVRQTFGVGVIVSVATAITIVVTLFIGRLADGKNRRSVLRLGSIFLALSWLVRIAVVGPFGALIADTMYRSSSVALGIPLIAMTYDHARRYSVTKTSVFMEMAIGLGKVIASLVAIGIVTFFPGQIWALAFAFAAALTLLFTRYQPDRDVAA